MGANTNFIGVQIAKLILVVVEGRRSYLGIIGCNNSGFQFHKPHPVPLAIKDALDDNLTE